MNNVPNPFVSVVIPVFNDSRGLEKCLDGLEKQTYARSLYEIIVVDNGSDEDIKSVVDQFSQAILTYESRPGSYAARNRGIYLAKGDVLAFIDSDCVPAPDWIERGAANLLSNPDIGTVGGKVEFLFRDVDRPNAVELYDSIAHFRQKHYIEELKFSGAGNLFTFRKVFDDVGFFNGTLRSGGDREWGQRVFSHGYGLIYGDDVQVGHPAIYSLYQLRKKTIRVIGGLHQLGQREGSSFAAFVWNLCRGLFPPLKFIHRVCSNKRLRETQKIKVVLIRLFVMHVGFWTRIRLR